MKGLLIVAALSGLCLASCKSQNGEAPTARTPSVGIGEPTPSTSAAPASDRYEGARRRMVNTQIAAREIDDERVLAAMRAVPRHLFVPEDMRPEAYDDHPLAIGHQQTISQPYIVGLMSALAEVSPPCSVLEVGTGSGYQAAVLAEMGCEVWTIEIVEPLATRSAALLRELGYDRIHVRHGDGYRGWPEHAPFDAVVITAAPPQIPEPLKEQLKVGGRLVVPVGRGYQDLVVLTRTEDGFDRRSVIPVRFVPMTGEAQTR